MKTKKLLFLFFCLNLCFSLSSQNSRNSDQFLNKLAEKNTAFLNDYSGDRIYLQTDKSLYLPGETIWFSSYLRNESDLRASENSDILHVELISPQNSVINHLKLIAIDGKAQGDFKLDESYPGGIYKIKAYTNWQMNDTNALVFEKKIQLQKTILPNLLLNLEFKEKGFGPSDWVTADFKVRTLSDLPLVNHQFEYSVMIEGKVIKVGKEETNDKGKTKIKFQLPNDLKSADGLLSVLVDYNGVKESISRSIPITLNKIQMEFYPEGGDLVLSMRSKVAFQSLNEFGKPVDVEGYIINEKEEKITSFSSFHQGMGGFSLLPELSNYKAIITKPKGIVDTFDLPVPLKVGYNLSVEKMNEEFAYLQIQTNRKTVARIVVSVRGEIYYLKSVDLLVGENSLVLPLKEFPVGVAKITLFDNKQIERCERLIFVNKHRELNIEVSTKKKVYAPREKVIVNIEVTDNTGMPMPGTFSMAVVSDKLITLADDKSGNILSKMLLEPDLLGKVEEPNFYFDKSEAKADKALDLLMLTKGWRRYTWKQIIKNPILSKKYPAEKAVIAGRLLNWRNSKPVNKHKVSIKETGEFVWTDKKGNFRFKGIDISKSNTLLFGEKNQDNLIVNEYSDNLVIYTPFYRKGYYSISTSYNSRRYNNSSIVGNIKDNEAKESLPFANVVLFKDGSQVNGTMSDFDGNFSFINLPEGVYDLKASYIGYESMNVSGLKSSPSSASLVNINMSSSSLSLCEFTVIQYSVPLISKDQTSSGATIRKQEILRMPGRSASSIAATVGGVYYRDDGSNELWIRGGRSNLTETYIDGVKAIEGFNLPNSAIEQIIVYTGGLPAKYEGYGVNIITRSYSSKSYYYYGYEGESSRFYNRKRFDQEKYRPVYYRAKEFPIIKYKTEELVEIRDDFRSTIYWNAKIETKRDGKAKVVFYNSDETTTFRLIIEGMSEDGMAGRTEHTYSVQKPWDLDVKIPPHTLVGDTVSLNLRFKNNTDNELQAEVMTDFPKSWRPLGNTTFKFNVGAQGFYNVLVDAIIDFPDKDTVAFLCSVNGKKEKILKIVQSSSRGFPYELAFSGSGKLKNDIDFEIKNQLHNSLSANVVIYPNALTDVLQGIESILREPHGCFEQVSSATYPNVLVLNYLKEQGKSNDELTQRAMDKIIKGYNKLAAYEISSGGFDWYGKPPGNEALTAFGIMEFTDMKKVYGGVSDAMIKRSIDWLLKKRDGKGQFNYYAPGRYGYGFADKNVTNAYVVWALSEAGVRDLEKELEFTSNKALQKKDPYQIALGAMSASNYGATLKMKKMIAQLIKMQNENGSWEGTIHSITRSSGKSLKMETTSLGVMALLRAEVVDRIALDRGVQYLFDNRSGHGSFGSTQATILAIKAITEYSSYLKSVAKPGHLSLVVNGITVAEINYSGKETKAIIFSGFENKLKTGSNKISILFDGTDKPLPYSTFVGWHTALPNNSKQVKVNLVTKLSESSVQLGKTNRLAVKIKNITSETLPNTMAIIGIPAGLSLQPWQLKELQEKESFDYYEIYDNRLVLYFRGMAPKEEIKIGFDLKADIPGKYASEASCVYLYYNDEDKYWTKSNVVEIIKGE